MTTDKEPPSSDHTTIEELKKQVEYLTARGEKVDQLLKESKAREESALSDAQKYCDRLKSAEEERARSKSVVKKRYKEKRYDKDDPFQPIICDLALQGHRTMKVMDPASFRYDETNTGSVGVQVMDELVKVASLDLDNHSKQEMWEREISPKFAYKLQSINTDRTRKMGDVYRGMSSIGASLSRALTTTIVRSL